MTRRSKVLVPVLTVAGVALVGLIGVRLLSRSADPVQYLTRPVAYADVSATVSETGTVNPVDEVSVGVQVSGTIRTLAVDYNSVVRKGEVLATLDPTNFEAALKSTEAGLMQQEASLNSAKVNVTKMKAQADLADLTVKRDRDLIEKGFITQSQLDTDQAAAVSALQDYNAAKAAVLVAQAQVSVARAQVDQSRYNLSQTIIASPIDGIVLARNVSVGQTVAASFQTPTLFTLATNLTDMEVDTSVDEADVGSVRSGESAEITVTAFPNVVFKGTVKQVRVNPTVTNNVVTYDAVVSVHDDSGRLFPGMTANVTINVGTHTHVPAIPEAALLYRPFAFRSAPSGGLVGGGFALAAGGGAASSSTVASAPGSQVTVWTLRDGRPVPVPVVIGLSDGKNVEITSGDLQMGEPVIVAQYRGARRGEALPGVGSSGAIPAGAGARAPAERGGAR